MATEIKTSFLEDAQYVPTSQVSSIWAETDEACIEVSLTCENGLNGEIETFFTTTLYAFEGRVELINVGALVEEYFRMREKVHDTIMFTFGDDSMDVHFLYCEYLMGEFDPSKVLFVSSQTQRVRQDSNIVIAAVDRGSATPFIFKIVGHSLTDNNITVVTKTANKALNNNGCRFFSVPEVAQMVKDELADVLFFSIEYGGLQKMCYLVPADSYLTFSFQNIFNVMEFIDVVGTMTSTTDVQREVTVCKGVSMQYDRSINRTFKVTTEALTQEEARSFEQFIASHKVYVWLDGNEWDVIITDHTCEDSTDDESLTVFSFTWQFSDKRPLMFNSLIEGIMPTHRNIFNDKFSPEYE